MTFLSYVMTYSVVHSSSVTKWAAQISQEPFDLEPPNIIPTYIPNHSTTTPDNKYITSYFWSDVITKKTVENISHLQQLCVEFLWRGFLPGPIDWWASCFINTVLLPTCKFSSSWLCMYYASRRFMDKKHNSNTPILEPPKAKVMLFVKLITWCHASRNKKTQQTSWRGTTCILFTSLQLQCELFCFVLCITRPTVVIQLPLLSTTEIHAINETSLYFMKMIHDMGLEVRSTAVCSAVRRVRYGPFTLTHALLTKHCDSLSIAENIDFCRPLVARAKSDERRELIGQQNLGEYLPDIRDGFSRHYVSDDHQMVNGDSGLVAESSGDGD